jgi:hypothetical protein
MLNLDLLGQIYLVSSVVGGTFILLNVLLGQLGSGGQSHSIHHVVHHIDSHHLIDNHSAAGHALPHISDHSIHHSINSHSTHIPHATDEAQNLLNNFVSGGIVERLSRRLLFFLQGEDIATPVGMFLITFLNPMRIAILLTFFGLFGLFISHALPILHYFSIIPAALAGLIVANLFSSSIRWMMDHMQSRSVHGENDLIGTEASVSITIPADKTGQIVYLADSVRCQRSAKLANGHAGTEIKRGTKVIIVGMEDRVALIEPIDDLLLLKDSEKNQP